MQLLSAYEGRTCELQMFLDASLKLKGFPHGPFRHSQAEKGRLVGEQTIGLMTAADWTS